MIMIILIDNHIPDRYNNQWVEPESLKQNILLK